MSLISAGFTLAILSSGKQVLCVVLVHLLIPTLVGGSHTYMIGTQYLLSGKEPLCVVSALINF